VASMGSLIDPPLMGGYLHITWCGYSHTIFFFQFPLHIKNVYENELLEKFDGLFCSDKQFLGLQMNLG
jgi:hypothetical protein